jgi:hypothetical protein
MEAIYEFIEANASKRAFVWFNVLTETVYSLERFPLKAAELLTGLWACGDRRIRSAVRNQH